MIDSVAEGASAPPDLKRAPRRRPAPADVARVDRLPPHSPEAEQGVLGCALLSPNECMGECIEKFKGSTEVFYDLRHQTIFSTLVEMFDTREAIDIITVQQRLKNKQLLEEVGGIAYLAGLPDAVPSAANLSYYLDIVQEKYLLRKMINACTDLVARVYDFEGEVDAALTEEHLSWPELLRVGEAASLPVTSLMAAVIREADLDLHSFLTVAEETARSALPARYCELTGSAVSRLVMTHHHFDHILGCGGFGELDSYAAPPVAVALSSRKALMAVAFAFFALALWRSPRWRGLPHAGLAVFVVALAMRLAVIRVAPTLSAKRSASALTRIAE